MRHSVAYIIKLYNDVCYINELTPEQQSSSLNKKKILFIPPLVLLHMLEFLCCRHVDPMRAQVALDDLQILVHHDQRLFLPTIYKDISWEILGICQHMTGNHQTALYSYTQSLRQIIVNKIDTATRHRIQAIRLTQLFIYILYNISNWFRRI